MNVLPLVFSFLALMTILTYSRLSGFVVSKAVHQEYEQFIDQCQETASFNAAQKKYDQEHKARGERSTEKGPRSKAIRKLNLWPLFKKGGEKSEETTFLFKSLIASLFKEARFYKEAIAHNPSIVDDLIQAMQTAYEALPSKAHFKKEDLYTLELKNPELQHFLYKIFKDPEGVILDDDEEALVSKRATHILNEVITVQYGNHPIRLYLADPALLKVLFNSDQVVETVVEERKNYYAKLKKSPDQEESLRNDFESRFISSLVPAVQHASVSWEISVTKPDK